ncbi:class I SAM-dependent methyltransferase [Bradyrhizobium liaoningense]|uniref:class I SAM-dependent methyltransferase n=1 Tax=Bradyrhizobium liaoningense TaxID=43992 RepID=UPI000554DBD2|nr:class I SAM-dependent methyltransferase [Bradyrhizobium liaoningense]
MKYEHFNNDQLRMSELYTRLCGWMDGVRWYQDDRVFSAIKSLIPAHPRTILELCCGTGKLLDQLSTAFPAAQIAGVDISSGMVRAARERTQSRNMVTVLVGDWMYDLVTEGADAYDVIVVKNALHLLDDAETRLRELSQLTHQRTELIIVETISPTSAANAFIRKLFRNVDDSDLKRSFFTEPTLAKLLRQSGWVRDIARPILVEQSIDIADWLSRKSSSEDARARAVDDLVRASANKSVRTAMKFDNPGGAVPNHMLRLQYISRYHWHPVETDEAALNSDQAVQLELV